MTEDLDFHQPMSYWQTCWLLLKGFAKSPVLSLDELAQMGDAAKTLTLGLLAPFIRFLNLLLFPITVPLWAYMAAREREIQWSLKVQRSREFRKKYGAEG